jgi:hypothetical protein
MLSREVPLNEDPWKEEFPDENTVPPPPELLDDRAVEEGLSYRYLGARPLDPVDLELCDPLLDTGLKGPTRSRRSCSSCT